jgi:uncharacterized protein YhfF
MASRVASKSLDRRTNRWQARLNSRSWSASLPHLRFSTIEPFVRVPETIIVTRAPRQARWDMDPDVRRVLEQAFPGEDARYFSPIIVGSTPASADEGAAAILKGSKTTTSIPFVGALSVLLDGQGCTRAIVETQRVEIIRFGAVDESFAWSYGEGERTLTWWRSNIGAWYRASAARHGASFSEDTLVICKWITVAKRL